MKLRAFKVKNFRCLYSTEWIPLSDLSIFTGENDGGKSTSLQVFDVFLSPKKTPVFDDYSYSINRVGEIGSNGREEEITVYGKFELRDSESSLLNALWGIEDKIVEVKRSFHINGGPSPYLFSAKTHSDEAFRRPLDDYTVAELKGIADRLSISLTGLTRKQDIIDAVRRWQRSQPQIDSEVEFPKSLIECLPEFRIFSSESALDPESEIKKTLITQFRSLVSNDKYSGPISQITEEIKGELNTELEKLTPFVQRYSSDIEAVTIRPDFNFASGLTTTALEIKRRDGKPILLQQSGAGQRRRFSLAIYEWSQEVFKDREENSRDLILAFDEPDTHLDYKSQRQIFDIIRKFADLPAIQVVVCTHSLNFIERVPINQIVHYSLDKSTRYTEVEVLASTVHEITELFLYEISKNMGLRNSVMLHERCFLAVEGQTEIAMLPVLFYKKYGYPLQAAGICLINGENNYGARMLTKFLNENRRQVVFLVDADSASDVGSKRYFTAASFRTDGIDEASQVHYVGTRELEDAFSDDIWTRMANKEYPKNSGSEWTTTDFAALRLTDKFSKKVQRLIKAEAGLPREPTKQDLGYKLALCLDPADVPQAVTDCLEKAFRLANG